MKILNRQRIKVNNNNTISIVEWSNGEFELAHLANGKVTYTVLDDVITTTEEKLSENIEDLAIEILAAELKKDYDVEVVETSIKIEMFTYDIWIDVSCNKGKLDFHVETSHLTRFADCDNFQDSVANRQIKKTFKGLLNYIKKFDR